MDFVLRREPAPDGRERVVWDDASDSAECTDKDDIELAEPQRLSADAGREIIRGQYDDLRACYESGLGRDPKLKGLVVVRLTIEVDGTVSQANVIDNRLRDCSVVACIKSRLQATPFPKSNSSTTLVYPLTFEPNPE